jgi:hypothetical protein
MSVGGLNIDLEGARKVLIPRIALERVRRGEAE